MEAAEQNGLNVGSLYIVEWPVESFESGSPTTAVQSIASYYDGDFVISGGFDIQDPEFRDSFYEFLNSVPVSTLNGWSVRYDKGLNPGNSIQATAVCFDAQ